jgi:acyl phosphate:glycerol-3-phosphate acyltransferase
MDGSRATRSPAELNTALFALAGYLAGSIPTGFWLVRALRGVDIRTIGSGNIGASNVWRTFARATGCP